MQKPLLAIITGRPGSGKSTLAQALSEEMRLPLLSRDRLKEGYVRTHGLDLTNHEEAARQVYELFFATIEAMVQSKVSLIAEAAFQHSKWISRLEPILPLTDSRLIICQAAPELLLARTVDRSKRDATWVAYHPMPNADLRVDEPYEPLRLDCPTILLDTSDGYRPNFAELLSFLGSAT